MTLRLGNKKVCPTKLVPVDKYFASNVVKVGTILDSKGVLSGFSVSSYAKLPSDISTNSASSWEAAIGFHYERLSGDGQVILGYAETGSNRYKSPQVWIRSGGQFELYLSSDGTSWDILNGQVSSIGMTEGTDYIVKLSYNGSTYSLDLSDDNGATWSNYISTTSQSKLYGLNNTTIGTGGGSSAMKPCIPSSVDLNKSYIKVNNQLVWQGVVPQGTRG